VVAPLVALLLGLLAVPGAAWAALQLEPVLSGLDSPLYVAQPRDGTRRLFVVEQPGRIKVLPPDGDAPGVFLDITDRVLAGGERGLLGLAFHPRFSSNGRFFVNYTRQPDGATVIAAFRVSQGDRNVADPGSEAQLLIVPQPFENHNGGMVEFGPDGLLYIALGDGGSGNDPGNRAQNPDELLGKVLRIDVDRSSGGRPYAVPASNPLAGGGQGREEIFALGFRNPFRFSFDRATGDLWAGDVGQGAVEEIDVVTAGGNYGWRVFEGSRCTNLGPVSCATPGFIPPVAEYRRSGGRCAVTGGYVYRGRAGALPAGAYVFGDFCSGEILLLENGAVRVVLDTPLALASFGEDEAGELYVVGLAGTVHRLVER
jgi:glucose/arabinose dehydrogenase